MQWLYISLHSRGQPRRCLWASYFYRPILGPNKRSIMGGNMKKALFLSMILGGSIMLLPSVEANAATPSANVAAPQIRVQIGQNRRNRRIRRVENRRIRTVTTTRV